MRNSRYIKLLNNNLISSGKIEMAEDFIHLISEDDSFLIEKKAPPFALLKWLRLELEKKGIIVLVNGSRRDVYPSGMTLVSSMAYVNSLGKQASLDDLVDIFDECTNRTLLSSVQEQELYHEEWLKSIGL
ncbi:hypothetical protein [Filimonas effusa]|uniref:Uncharacterized protein n=1 Tax=Filimonas effusa TaxID=2508721 RepID=A0A4Q1D9U6_9BACT|nr:hypothetical protein [Filimonas effusa]RXK86141.1 hypothetical protein ESB13_04845 [Filimonas effusa]